MKSNLSCHLPEPSTDEQQNVSNPPRFASVTPSPHLPEHLTHPLVAVAKTHPEVTPAVSALAHTDSTYPSCTSSGMMWGRSSGQESVQLN